MKRYKYEYMIGIVTDSVSVEFERWLNAWGADGWYLVHVVGDKYIFCRRVGRLK